MSFAVLFRPKCLNIPDNKVHGANIGPTWVLSAQDGPHVGPMNLVIRDIYFVYPCVWLSVGFSVRSCCIFFKWIFPFLCSQYQCLVDLPALCIQLQTSRREYWHHVFPVRKLPLCASVWSFVGLTYFHDIHLLTHCGQTKWPPFCRRHFKMQICRENIWVLI